MPTSTIFSGITDNAITMSKQLEHIHVRDNKSESGTPNKQPKVSGPGSYVLETRNDDSGHLGKKIRVLLINWDGIEDFYHRKAGLVGVCLWWFCSASSLTYFCVPSSGLSYALHTMIEE
ncbi:uncharacterized protein PAC_16603 [Phialocephala subalpina]|uniref:Uncharacterized protein n=1 Tax=Phialocephala subalpina TaxID=576137 RepID=A0A1L7XNV1_9HELO|nr:uncharacterized protein PAC_16603 [Phialocephala subalpina]